MKMKMFFYVAVIAIVASMTVVLAEDDASGPAPGPTGSSSTGAGTSLVGGMTGVGGFILSFLTFFLQ